jgi:hypothetical protein
MHLAAKCPQLLNFAGVFDILFSGVQVAPSQGGEEYSGFFRELAKGLAG